MTHIDIDTLSKSAQVQQIFSTILSRELDLIEVPTPIITKKTSHLNDNLTGTEKKVLVRAKDGDFEIIQSAAKIKRMLMYHFKKSDSHLKHQKEGIFMHMTAIRTADELDPTHSPVVEQWDWEALLQGERSLDTLYNQVRRIWDCIKLCAKEVSRQVPEVVHFITTAELERLYPQLPTQDERINEYVKEKHCVFLSQITEDRAPDYDDWQLNGDLMVWHNSLSHALELSSMGIRVNAERLTSQCDLSSLPSPIPSYYTNILNGITPDTIGGGIGRCRLAMYLMDVTHISQVQYPFSLEE